MLYLFSPSYWRSQRVAMQQERASAEFERGFNWMAGELLRGKEPETLERNLDFTFDSTSFDYGASSALNSWYARATINRAALDKLVHTAGGCGCASHC